jgi:hypothetical protein
LLWDERESKTLEWIESYAIRDRGEAGGTQGPQCSIVKGVLRREEIGSVDTLVEKEVSPLRYSRELLGIRVPSELRATDGAFASTVKERSTRLWGEYMLVPMLGEIDHVPLTECSHDVPKVGMRVLQFQFWIPVFRDYAKKGFNAMSIQ